MSWDVLVVGAGVAGLQCARRLQQAGRAVLVLDQARAVGGRCATRRFEGQPVDFGPFFIHGHQPEFLDALAQVEGVSVVPGWPRRVEGRGMPCQPDAYAPYERRVTLAEGLRRFPEHLAQGLELRLQTRVEQLHLDAERLSIRCAGETLEARDLVLALPLEQSAALLQGLPESATLASARSLLGMFASLPSLTLIAGYPLDVELPAWDLAYPEDSQVLITAARDSSKRAQAGCQVMVFQARPRWSRQNLDASEEVWSQALLDAAVQQFGPAVGQPSWTHAHRWRYARVDRGNELAGPLLLRWNSAARLGIVGDIFAPGGGVQASWLSGHRLAGRLLDEE